MGSDLYHVKAVSKQATTAVFDVKVIHPDVSTIPEDRSFALMLLREAADDSLLAREVTTDDMLDRAWVKKYASGFIQSVDLTTTGKSAKRGRLTVTVFEPAWLDHVKPGESFDTAAFQLLDKYSKHPPILLTKGAAKAPAGDALDDGDGFIWVPREAHGPLELIEPLPPFLQVPAYSLSAYEVVDEVSGKKIAPKLLQAWHGKAVQVTARGKAQGGALGFQKNLKDHVALLSVRGYGGSKIEAIGRLRLKPGRRGTKLSYAEVLEYTQTSVTQVKKKGDTLELTCRMPPDGRKVPFASESDVLALLARPLGFDFFKQGFKTKAPLGDALTRDLREQELGEDEDLYPAVARAYVASFTVEGATKPKKKLTAEALDALTPPAALAALSAPWPTFTLRIKVTDPKWIAHVDDELPMFTEKDTVFAKPATLAKLKAAKEAVKEKAAKAKAKAKAPRKPAPKRVILWHKKGASDKVWIASQDGATWKAQYGRRTMPNLEEKIYELASEEKASAAFAKAVEAKKREGYRVAPAYDAAAEVLWKRLGLAFDDSSGVPAVTKVGPPATAATHFENGFKAGDTIYAVRPRKMVGTYKLRTIEELAVVVESLRAGEDVLLETSRKLGKSGMMTTAVVTLR
ncbi:hypothetical protein [Nannocystis radixulma]|uniref:WGR domain-containing protein n=1 Tax=Nannocystis radixulma TaxID=2995305 RepID=A0ABT5AX89_9BACT|nr:hypothetical protein [Nannocystis radixulma]MDC0666459.1 hypothetical protein [Nannocystis radixulma]